MDTQEKDMGWIFAMGCRRCRGWIVPDLSPACCGPLLMELQWKMHRWLAAYLKLNYVSRDGFETLSALPQLD
jgi:hypothetical protein